MSDNQESLLLPELPAPSTTILVSMGWAMLDYVRYNIAHTIPFKSWINGSVPLMALSLQRMSDNQESLLLPELPAPSTTILASMGWAMLDYVRYNIAHTIPVCWIEHLIPFPTDY
ncbi:hypothetical protein C8J57DRAFT_1524968 [Mycena rebaudengoi]|nr:hypothetical protein C8J57DRAFT_1524968 [Mycena rebaudengoi]